MLHCETANFWTHFIPALLAVLLILSNLLFYPLSFYTHQFDWSILQLQDRLVLSVGLVGVCVCFSISSIFHILSCHAELAAVWNQLDLMGIIFMNTLLSVSLSYYKFYGSITGSSISISFVVITGTVSILIVRAMRDPRDKPRRVLVYAIATLLLSLPPCISIYWKTHTHTDVQAAYLVGSGLICGGVGGIFYATRLPERLFPGYFDLLCSSHMCMHVFTAVAVFLIYESIIKTAISTLTS